MAAISSGVHHPGLLSNDEVVSSMHPLASRYNDIAPIEQNAASVAFALATRSEQAAIGSADSLTDLALEQTVLSFVCNNSASPQFQKQQRPGALYVGFRRRVLRLMTSPSGVALFPPLESAELEAIYVAACNGWCCSDGPGIQRWRDLLRLQAIRHCRSFEGHEAERVAAFQSRAEEAYAKSMADLHRRDSLIMSTRVA
jgi:hypothetical protein